MGRLDRGFLERSPREDCAPETFWTDLCPKPCRQTPKRTHFISGPRKKASITRFSRGNPTPETFVNVAKARLLEVFVKKPDVYRCPGDKTGRIRSVSMNGYMNGTGIWQDSKRPGQEMKLLQLTAEQIRSDSYRESELPRSLACSPAHTFPFQRLCGCRQQRRRTRSSACWRRRKAP